MANNYYDATGVLVLDQVTPVITALFGGFNLHGAYPCDREVYIAKISEDNDPSWEEVFENLEKLVENLSLSIPDGDEGGVESMLRRLATHFKAGEDKALCHLIEHQDFDDGVDLEALFIMATRFDDGHGLKAIKFEGAWHCDKARLFEFGGNGVYISREVSIESHSSQALTLGGDIHAALLNGKLDDAAARIAKEAFRILSGVADESIRETLRIKLSCYLAQQASAVESGASEPHY